MTLVVLTYGSSATEAELGEGTRAGAPRANRRAMLLIGLVAAAACLAAVGMVPNQQQDVLDSDDLNMYSQADTEYSHADDVAAMGLGTANQVLSGLSDTNKAWIGTGDEASLQSLRSETQYDPNSDSGADRAAEADLDDENMPLSDSLTIPTPPIDTDSTSTLHGLQGAHSRANAHGDDDNELHMGLSALRKHVISQDIDQPRQQQKEREQHIFREAARKEAEMKASLHAAAAARKAKHAVHHSHGARRGKGESSRHRGGGNSGYQKGAVKEAEKELKALRRQAQHKEAGIKQKDEVNIEALKMEEKDAEKDERRRLAEVQKQVSGQAKLLEAHIAELKKARGHEGAKGASPAQEERLKQQIAAIKRKDKQRLAVLTARLQKVDAGKATKPPAKKGRLEAEDARLESLAALKVRSQHMA